MKCEKCNEREAVLFYKANINGDKTEKNLCAKCAKEEGFGELMSNRFGRMPMTFFRDPFEDFLGEYFGGFFGPRVLPSFSRSWFAPMFAPMLTMPRIEITLDDESREPVKAAVASEEAEKSGKVDAELNARRELKALKHQLEEAIKAEEFEKCVELRDKIRQLEGK